ncbi:hypothetical protein [Bacillus thuringiensis]|uniref:hypothetical protein n=1 Tax=Bacillus thuringiensis TaxID=1428 RepID=UPI0021E70F7E|nr:hypothetical protein [Bacillus thuringiensis]
MTRRIGFSNMKVFLRDADFFGDDSNLVDVPYKEILIPSDSFTSDHWDIAHPNNDVHLIVSVEVIENDDEIGIGDVRVMVWWALMENDDTLISKEFTNLNLVHGGIVDIPKKQLDDPSDSGNYAQMSMTISNGTV